VLFSLYDLYLKASKRIQGSVRDIENLKDQHPNSDQYKQTVKSEVYLGYKILWVIKLFLGGRKFPYGNIKETKWRTYIHDIVEFITTEKILQSLLKIDAEAFF